MCNACHIRSSPVALARIAAGNDRSLCDVNVVGGTAKRGVLDALHQMAHACAGHHRAEMRIRQVRRGFPARQRFPGCLKSCPEPVLGGLTSSMAAMER